MNITECLIYFKVNLYVLAIAMEENKMTLKLEYKQSPLRKIYILKATLVFLESQ